MSVNRVLKVAILCSFNLELIARPVKELLKAKGFVPELYFCGYGQWEADVLNPASNLYAFEPDLVFLFVEFSDLFSVDLWMDAEAQQWGDSAWNRVERIIQHLLDRLPDQTSILCHNLLVPPTTSFGLLEGNGGYSLTRSAETFNQNLRHHVAHHPRLFLLDYANFIVQQGWSNCYDQRLWHLGRMRLSRVGLTRLADYYLRYIGALTLPRRKCLVLDLDNTLWGGVIGEDGLMGIQLGHEGIGLAYREFQQAILALSQRGVVLAVSSKNNPQDALSVLENHPDSILRPEHFACMEINWEPKPNSIQRIAETLNLGLDSFVFWDDNPMEREAVIHQVPDVWVVDVPDDASDYAACLLTLACFDSLSLTQVDRQRSELYRQQVQRQQSQAQVSTESLEEFYQSLNIVVTLSEARELTIPRIAQLTQRTNQFNLTTQRRSESEVLALANNPAYRLYGLQLQDRFGDLGIVGAAIIQQHPQTWILENLLVSCRALGRNIEDAFLHYLLTQAQQQGAQLQGVFKPTAKNMPIRQFLGKYGLAPPENWQGEQWDFVVPLTLPSPPPWITLMESAHVIV